MAAGNTIDTRVHVMGDLYLLSGTFTDGGTDIFFGDHLSTVFAAGGHYTSNYATGVETNGAKAVGDTAFVVKTVDKRLHFNVGETLYDSVGDRLGVITAMAADATGITVGGGVLKVIGDSEAVHKHGAMNPAITLSDDQLDISIDTKNNYLVIGTGNLGAASRAATGDGRWWALGKR